MYTILSVFVLCLLRISYEDGCLINLLLKKRELFFFEQEKMKYNNNNKVTLFNTRCTKKDH